ncbi:hypothetical protein HK101_011441 [Irineochytrium annulatum]|nr:hypothetical protein HK101_011441 [Irineochytrium annulatum]
MQPATTTALLAVLVAIPALVQAGRCLQYRTAPFPTPTVSGVASIPDCGLFCQNAGALSYGVIQREDGTGSCYCLTGKEDGQVSFDCPICFQEDKSSYPVFWFCGNDAHLPQIMSLYVYPTSN